MLKTPRTLGIAALSLLFFSQAMFADYADVVERTFLLKNGGELELKASLGDIRIHGGDTDKCVVQIFRKVRRQSETEALKTLENLEIKLEQKKPNKIEVELKNQQGWLKQLFGGNRDMEIIIEVTLPSQTEINANTKGGDVEVSDIISDIDLSSSGGDIRLNNCSGDASLATSGGDLYVEHFSGEIDLKTAGGDIDSDYTEGELDARSTGGDIRILKHVGMVDAASTGGDIDLSYNSPLIESIKLKSTGGDIMLQLLENSSFTFEAEALGGDIAVQFNDVETLKRNFKSWEAQVNGKGPRIVLKSLGGDIDIASMEPEVL